MGRLWVLIQWLLPQNLLSRFVGKLASTKRWARPMIDLVVRLYRPNLNESEPAPDGGWPTFNTFFTRELKPNTRDLSINPAVLKSPCDGTVSELGDISSAQLTQAKGQTYTVAELLDANPLDSESINPDTFAQGSWITIYLAPKDYHRVHMPSSGTLTGTREISGSLFSVNDVTTQYVPKLFCRNARTVSQFSGENGEFAVVMVGALIVGAMRMAWQAEPDKEASKTGTNFNQCSELGFFEMGSTVILLTQKRVEWEGVSVGSSVKLGQSLATW